MTWCRNKWIWCLAFSWLLGIVLLGSLIRISPKVYYDPSSAMSPTIQAGEKILCARLWKPVNQIPRGTVVTFDAAKAAPGLSGTHIKRLIAFPGDRIEVLNGELSVNGSPLPVRAGERATPPKNFRLTPEMIAPRYPHVVPAGKVFVLGDHYSNSLDSRHYGPIPQTAIERIALRRIAPFSRMGKIE